MTIIRAIAFLLHFTIVPVALGRLITYKQRNDRDSAIATYIIGLFASFGIFYVMCSLLAWHQYWNTITEAFVGCFSALCLSYSVDVLILVLLWIRKDYNWIKNLYKSIKTWIFDRVARLRDNKLIFVYVFVFVALLLVQMYFAYKYEINEWSYDDYDYVANSLDTINSDTIAFVNFVNGSTPYISVKRAMSSWPTYIAYLSMVSGFEVTTICHTILPVLLLVIAYIAYGYVSGFLFEKSENKLIFMSLLAVANIFGLYSHYSNTFRLLGALWQGKAVLSAIAIPFFFIYLFNSFINVEETKLLPLSLFSLGAYSLSTMAALLMTETIVAVWITACIYKRKIYGIKILIASLVGFIFFAVYYVFMYLLISDMLAVNDFRYFRRGTDVNWWYRWFG